jgi:hypothetical protein
MLTKMYRTRIRDAAGSDDFLMQKVYLLRLMPVWVGLIMLVALFCQSPLIKG